MEKSPNWMNYAPMLQFYKKSSKTKNSLQPDEDFLDSHFLGRYQEHSLKNLNLPENIKSFLTEVGLPDKFDDFRSPDEENRKEACPGIVFWLNSLNVREIDGKKYLVIGERRSLDRICTIINASQPDETKCWEKSEGCVYMAVQLETGEVWKWIPACGADDEDILIFVNSSLEQYLLSMAYWRAFYPDFAKQVCEFTEKNPDGTELDFIFDHDELYNPFLDVLKCLDPKAIEDEFSYWSFMCDLSLY